MSKNKKDRRKIRLQLLGGLIAVIYLALTGRLYFVQDKYGVQDSNNAVYNNVQYERISDISYQLLDKNGKELLKYKKNYVVVIDSKPFKLNNYRENVEEIMALELIMKNETKDFSFDNIIKSDGKNYYNVSEDSYNKIKILKHVKGLYSYCYENVDKGNTWSIQNIIANIGDDKGEYSEGTLPFYINNINSINKKNTINFYLDSNIQYKESGYTIDKDNLIPYTTIDKDWNDKIKDILSKEKYKSLGNIGVIILEKGKIRALQCKDDNQPNTILASTGLGYEPGSTFKILVLQAALEEKKTYLGEKFICKGDICKKAHGTIDLQTAVKVSCNDAFAELGNRLGYDKIMEYANKYGLCKSILGLPKEIEAEGVKPGYNPDETVNNISIGQTFNVPPIQIAGIYDSIINDGYFYKPYMIDKIMDYSGDVVKTIEPVKEKISSKEISNAIKGVLRETVASGTGIAAQVSGVDIGGKTGSSTGSEFNESGESKSTHGWFVGYFNLGSTYYTMLVFAPNIDGKNEKGEELQGGNTCAPVFKEVVESIVK